MKYILALLLACLPLGANAASFDCGQATHPLELLICNDYTLSELDTEVGNTYKNLYLNALGATKAQHLDEQRYFLRARAERCPIPAGNLLLPTEIDQTTGCLKELYRTRLTELKQYQARTQASPISPAPIKSVAAETSDLKYTTAPPPDDSLSPVAIIILLLISSWIAAHPLLALLQLNLKGLERKIFLIIVTLASALWMSFGFWYGMIFASLSAILFIADNNRRSDFSKCRAIIEAHGKELAIKRKQLVIPRGYGLYDEKGWEKEKDFFLKNLVYAQVGRCTQLESFRNKVSVLFDEVVNSINIQSADMLKGMNARENAREYEYYVAEVLCEHGWDAHATKGAADQGIDVIAVMGGLKVVIQCKLYSNSVGNAAVQEIIAGREFAKADFAAVVSNIQYTLHAKRLAASSNVLLLHDAELPELYSMITKKIDA